MGAVVTETGGTIEAAVGNKLVVEASAVVWLFLTGELAADDAVSSFMRLSPRFA